MTATARVGCEPPRSAAHAKSGAPGSAARRNDADARRYLRLTLGHTLAMYAVLAAALAGVLPAWTLVLAVPWLYVRLSLGLHELLHVRAADDVPGFHRLAMIFDTPFGLGYREHRAIHLRHHRFAGDSRDPERWQIEGSHCRAFANALITPERSLFNWIRTRGIDASLVREGAFRCVFFVAVAVAEPARVRRLLDHAPRMHRHRRLRLPPSAAQSPRGTRHLRAAVSAGARARGRRAVRRRADADPRAAPCAPRMARRPRTRSAALSGGVCAAAGPGHPGNARCRREAPRHQRRDKRALEARARHPADRRERRMFRWGIPVAS